MTDDSTTFIIGMLWSLLSISVPLVLLSQGIFPEIMFGATIGAMVRFLTDFVLISLQIRSGGGSEVLTGRYAPVTVLMMLFQFGTLAAGFYLLFVTANPVGAGMAGIIILTYLFGAVVTMLTSDEEGSEPEQEDDEESEWRFEVDEV